MYKLGCHLSTSNGFKKMGEVAVKINANTFQFFTRNPRGGAARSLAQHDLDSLCQILADYDFGEILAHSPYTLNMASANPQTRAFAKRIFEDDLVRLNRMPCQLYNIHPGSHSGQGVMQGIEHISEIINEVLNTDFKAMILLETMSGKGSEIGSTFQELREIINSIENSEKVGICLDTCHLFSAGYDIVNDLDGVLEELDIIIGLEKVKAVHLNDSLNEFNSNKDRHAGVGEGQIGLEAIIRFAKHPQLRHLPFILETPYDVEGHAQEILSLREHLDGMSSIQKIKDNS